MSERNSEGELALPGEIDPREAKEFSRIFKMYYARLCYFSCQIVGDRARAEDICQEVFLRFWRQREHIPRRETFLKNYLYTGVRNASISILRHDRVVEQYQRQQDTFLSGETSVMHSMIRSEVVAEIYQALKTLPPGCRQIVQMAFMEGMKNTEIALKLGVSVNTVKTQRQRAIKLLRSKVRLKIFILLSFF